MLAVFGLIAGLMSLKSSRARASREAAEGSGSRALREPVAIEIQPGGLRLAGRLLTAADGFGTATAVLGNPTRTNAYRKAEGALEARLARGGGWSGAGQPAAEAAVEKRYATSVAIQASAASSSPSLGRLYSPMDNLPLGAQRGGKKPAREGVKLWRAGSR